MMRQHHLTKIQDHWLQREIEKVGLLTFDLKTFQAFIPFQIHVSLKKSNPIQIEGQHQLSQSYQSLTRNDHLTAYKYIFAKGMLKHQSFQHIEKLDELRQCLSKKIMDFNFQDPKKVLFCGKPQSWITFISCMQNNGIKSLRLAQAAAIIVKNIKEGNYSQMSTEIQKMWDFRSEVMGFMNNKLKKQTAVAVARLKGMFSPLDSYGHQHYLHPKVYNQVRFTQGATRQNAFIFHPTSTTRQIFQLTAIDKIQKAHKDQKKIYVYGQGGIGKSISFCLLAELHNLIQDFHHIVSSCTYTNFKQFDQTYNQQSFQRLPKYFYYNLYRGDSNFPRFLQAVKLQFSPYANNIPDNLSLLTDSQAIQKVVEWYKNCNIEVVFIIDQINIYFSQARQKYSRGQLKQASLQARHMSDISNLLQSLKGFNVIFVSSENAQIYIIKETSMYSFDQDTLQLEKIQFEVKSQTQQGMKQTLQTILFQVQHQITKLQVKGQEAQQLIRQKIMDFRLLQKLELSSQLKQYLSLMTHQRVKLFFKANPKMILKKINEKSEFQEYLQEIANFIINHFSQIYKKFIFNKGNTSQAQSRFIKMTEIRCKAAQQYKKSAQQPNSDYNNLYFDFNFPFTRREQQYTTLFKEHTQFMDDYKMRIYFSPKRFLQITSFMDEQLNIYASVIKQVINICAVNPVWLETSFDVVHTTIFTQFNILLQIDGQNFRLMSEGFKANKFEHFLKFFTKDQNQNLDKMRKKDCKITKTNSVYLRFYKLFQILQSRQTNFIQEICAAPCTKQLKAYNILKPISSKYSHNSQCIDFLIIKQVDKRVPRKNKHSQTDANQESHYNLDTFDFCVSFNKSYINNKIERARYFYKKFVWITEIQNQKDGQFQINKLLKERQKYIKFRKYKFDNITHWILVPEQMIKKLQTPNTDQKFHIKLVSLEKMSYMFIDKNQEVQNIIQLSSMLLKKIKENK